jgi:hypothetical protein
MRPAIYAISALLALGPAPAWAACGVDSGNPAYIQQSPAAVLVGSTACYPSAGPNWTNQEYLSGGNVIDYKKGPGDPVDPTSQVGTYVINGDDTITYQYGGSDNYTYSVWGPTASGGNIYDFCTGTTPLPGQVKVLPGQVPCG